MSPALLVALCENAEASVLAARSLQGERLQRLADERTRLLFDIRCGDPFDLSDPDVVSAGRRLRSAEVRLERISRAVLDVMDAANPVARPARYGRAGRIEP